MRLISAFSSSPTTSSWRTHPPSGGSRLVDEVWGLMTASLVSASASRLVGPLQDEWMDDEFFIRDRHAQGAFTVRRSVGRLHVKVGMPPGRDAPLLTLPGRWGRRNGHGE